MEFLSFSFSFHHRFLPSSFLPYSLSFPLLSLLSCLLVLTRGWLGCNFSSVHVISLGPLYLWWKGMESGCKKSSNTKWIEYQTFLFPSILSSCSMILSLSLFTPFVPPSWKRPRNEDFPLLASCTWSLFILLLQTVHHFSLEWFFS